MFKHIEGYHLTATERKIVRYMIENKVKQAGTKRITCKFDGTDNEGNTILHVYTDRRWNHKIKIAA